MTTNFFKCIVLAEVSSGLMFVMDYFIGVWTVCVLVLDVDVLPVQLCVQLVCVVYGGNIC
jgi:hypothetical protein